MLGIIIKLYYSYTSINNNYFSSHEKDVIKKNTKMIRLAKTHILLKKIMK